MGSTVPVLMIECPVATVPGSSRHRTWEAPPENPLLPPCSWEISELFEEVERILGDSRTKEKEGQHWEDR